MNENNIKNIKPNPGVEPFPEANKSRTTVFSASRKPTSTSMNIYQKISKIQDEITAVVRDETNNFQKYTYFEEYQVLSKLKPLLSKHDLLIVVSDEVYIDNEARLIHERNEKEHVVKYLKKMEMINTSKPEEKLTFHFWAIGQNADPAKAKGAAETYAMKYLLTKFFLIPVKDKNDPDYYKKENEVKSNETKKATREGERVYTCMECNYPQLEVQMRTIGNRIICLTCLNKKK